MQRFILIARIIAMSLSWIARVAAVALVIWVWHAAGCLTDLLEALDGAMTLPYLALSC
jgi:hypothetical protein